MTNGSVHSGRFLCERNKSSNPIFSFSSSSDSRYMPSISSVTSPPLRQVKRAGKVGNHGNNGHNPFVITFVLGSFVTFEPCNRSWILRLR